jgi:3-hydroxybutyryl-CoA dehydrogenase
MTAIENIAVVGAGTMGRGIAQVAAMGGFKVLLADVDRKVLDRALANIETHLKKGVDLGKITAADKTGALSRIEPNTDLAPAVSDADLIIEAVPENLVLKQDIFRQLEAHCPPDTLLATNTSALSITEIAAVVDNPARVIGMHFFNPVHIMKLVEIICGLETSQETLTACLEVCARMGKQAVSINESPGFVTSRINALIGNEAFIMLQEGLGTAEDIDQALKLGLNHPMGPFEMVDLVGLDTRLSILEHLHKTLGEKYRPAPLMVKYVKAGRLGRKVGIGVYDYRKTKK